MSWSDIQGTPVLVTLVYTPVDSQPPKVISVLLGYGVLGNLFESNLNLSQDEQNLLKKPLDKLFDAQWSDLQRSAQDMVKRAIQSGQASAYNISVSPPQQGTLRA